MATIKNINMKSYNGTDYDTLYPATQTSQVLGNWDLTKVNGLLDVEHGGTGTTSLDNLAKVMKVQSGFYTGTGTYGSSNKNSLTFNFYPKVLFIDGAVMWHENWMTQIVTNDVYNQRTYGIIFSLQGKTLSWYTNSAASQYNEKDSLYCWTVLGETDLDENNYSALITSSGNFVVPFTGNYYLELHGGGGGLQGTAGYGYTSAGGAGGSGNKWDSITLTAGDTIAVSIGRAAILDYTTTSTTQQIKTKTASTGTSFGSYTVAKGGDGASQSVGIKAGNIATNGKDSYTSNRMVEMSGLGGGYVGAYYGAGAVWYSQPSTQSMDWIDGTPGCVYLRYLGNS